MPSQPGGNDLHRDQLLTGISVGYKNMAYIADRIFPIVEVNKQSGLITAYAQSHWFRDSAQLRKSGSRSRGGGWDMAPDLDFYCPRYSWRHEIDDETRDQTDDQFKLDRDATNFCTDKVQLRREIGLASQFFGTGVWNGDLVGGTDFTQWDDYASSDPLVNLTTYADTMEGNIGVEPNTLVMGKAVWLQLKWHPALIDMIKYTQRGQITSDMLSSLLEVDRILIGRAIYTDDPEGTAEASVTYKRVWGKAALLLYVPANPSLMSPAAGYTLVWNRVPNAIQYIKRFRDDEREVDIIEANTYFVHKVTSPRAGKYLSGIVS